MSRPRLPLVLTVLVLTLALCHAPAPLAAADLTFGVFGDCRPGERNYSPVLEKMAREMAARRPAFVIGTGDYVEGSRDEATMRAQWAWFFRGIAPLQSFGPVPVALAPGNHDIVGSRRNQHIYREYFDDLYFSFSRGPYHFIILDSEEPGREGRIVGEQLAWLKANLAAHRAAKLTFVALHRPLYPVAVHRGNSLDRYPEHRDALHRLFVDEGVDCVFMGHEHLYHRQERDGVDYVITGGAGAPLYAPPDRGGFYHYLMVEITGDTYRIDVHRL